MRVFLAAGIYVAGVILAAQSARADEPSAAFCVTVRLIVKELGEPEAERLARERGATDAQIARARKCKRLAGA